MAKSFTTLQVKKFDLEFTVDPLFKKTCADFDEGGAMGLLMNHLSVDGKGRVVFDAGDAGVDEEEEEAIPQDEELVDISKLRGDNKPVYMSPRQLIPLSSVHAINGQHDVAQHFRYSFILPFLL